MGEIPSAQSALVEKTFGGEVMEIQEVLQAVSLATGAVQKLGKGERNKHDGYNFASIDDFLALVNPICAEHGLVILSNEESLEDFDREGRQGPKPWVRGTFSFTVYHKSGQSLPPVTRTAEVMRNGAQAYGSLQSYCLKQFLRGLLLIPTGDKDDADLHPTDGGAVSNYNRVHRPQAPAPTADAIRTAIDSLSKAMSMDALKAIFTDLPRDVQALPEVIKAKDDRKSDLTRADLADEIPY